MKLRTPADFGAVIRDRRLKLGLKQQELAGKVGAGREWVVGLEKGKPGARLALVLRTLDVLGISLTVGLTGGLTQDAGKRKKGAKTRPVVDIDRLLDNLRKKKS